MARVMALTALVALGLSGRTFHEPFHADDGLRSMAVTESSEWGWLQRRCSHEDDMYRQDSRTAYSLAESCRS